MKKTMLISSLALLATQYEADAQTERGRRNQRDSTVQRRDTDTNRNLQNQDNSRDSNKKNNPTNDNNNYNNQNRDSTNRIGR